MLLLNIAEVQLASFQGLCIGELFYAIVMLFKRRKKLPICSIPMKVIIACVLSLLPSTYMDCSKVQVCTVSLIWLCLRLTTSAYSLLYGDLIFKEHNASIGQGLAINYWTAFLQPVLTNFQYEVRDLQERIESHFFHSKLRGLDFDLFNKLVILLPSSCSKDGRTNDRLFQLSDIDKTVFNTDEVTSIQFKTGKPCKICWIYRNESDESLTYKQDSALRCEKLFFISDFPTLLKSALGPNRGWEDEGERIDQLKQFSESLKALAFEEKLESTFLFCNYGTDDGSALSQHVRTCILGQKDKVN